MGLSRNDLFASIERRALSALPATRYEYAQWCLARVSLDYHVEVERFLYSVPHTLLREQVEVRMTSRIAEIFHQSKRVAVHQPSSDNSTLANAILDRIVHNAYRIELSGETLRDRIDDTIDHASPPHNQPTRR